MDVGAPRGLLRFFDEVEDPRMERTRLHSLSDILYITLCAVICGADSLKSKRLRASLREDYLLKVLCQAV